MQPRGVVGRVKEMLEPSVPSTTIVNDGSIFVMMGFWCGFSPYHSEGITRVQPEPCKSGVGQSHHAGQKAGPVASRAGKEPMHRSSAAGHVQMLCGCHGGRRAGPLPKCPDAP